MIDVIGLEEFQGLPVHIEHPDTPGALRDAVLVLSQKCSDVRDALRAPYVEERFDLTEILDPHGRWREIEDIRIEGL